MFVICRLLFSLTDESGASAKDAGSTGPTPQPLDTTVVSSTLTGDDTTGHKTPTTEPLGNNNISQNSITVANSYSLLLFLNIINPIFFQLNYMNVCREKCYTNKSVDIKFSVNDAFLE